MRVNQMSPANRFISKSRQAIQAFCAMLVMVPQIFMCLSVDAEEAGVVANADSSMFGIVGLRFSLEDKHLPVIEEVFPNMPAAKGNLTRGDQIVTVDGLPTKNLNRDQVFERITGKPGATVKMHIIRNQKEFAVSLIRIKLQKLEQTQPALVKDYLSASH
jgi:C-terminal processing protease CtpA/Prc